MGKFDRNFELRFQPRLRFGISVLHYIDIYQVSSTRMVCPRYEIIDKWRLLRGRRLFFYSSIRGVRVQIAYQELNAGFRVAGDIY